VNPKYAEVQGLRCYPDVAALPAAPDLAILAVNAPEALGQLRALHAKGARAAMVYASGFEEENSDEARARGAALADFARETGMPICGPNCMGGANYVARVYTAFVPSFLTEDAPGDTALLTQSGNMCSVLWRHGREAGLRFSHLINTGNETGVEFAEYLEFLAADPDTRRVVAYLEGLRDGPRFLAAARALRAAGKPLIVLKGGRTAKGAEAARSHTAALAGDGRAYDAAFAECGVAVAEDLRQVVDLAMLDRFAAKSTGPRIGVVTVSGAAGALLADQITARGTQLPALSDATEARLKRVIPAFGAVANPVDMTGNVINSMEAFREVFAAVAEDAAVDQVLLYLPGPLLAKALPLLAEIVPPCPKLVTVLDNGAAGNRDGADAAGLAFFADMTACIRALAGHAAWRATAARAAPPEVPQLPDEAAALLAEGAAPLTESAALAVLDLPTPAAELVRTREAAKEVAQRLGFPVVAKVASADIAHKTEVGGVRLDLADADAVAAAFDGILVNAARLAPGARVEGVLLQKQMVGGVELLLGGTRDPVFGWLLTVGLGGVWVELMGDAAHALAPVSESEAAQLLRRLRGFPLLDGHRGRPRADQRAAAAAIAAFSQRLVALPESVREAEVNPLIVLPEGQGAFAADALILRGD
jgi:acyl-CoA synthetase (NDP forming)